jgi:hypothetical protein
VSFDRQLYKRYESLCLTRLSPNFILRDFMFSTEAAVCGHSNFPVDDVALVAESGRALCEKVLEPVLEKFGQFAITFGYQARETMDRELPEEELLSEAHSSNPHHWDRETFSKEVYARVDILPFCVEDGAVTKEAFGRWCMMNLDIDLLMQWRKTSVCCITISPYPRRVWLEWVPQGEGDNSSNKIEYMGASYWRDVFPGLDVIDRPKHFPSSTNGSLRFGNVGAFLRR